MFVGDTNVCSMLLSNVRVAKHTEKEGKPTPEKPGIKLKRSKRGVKPTMPERVLFDLNKFILLKLSLQGAQSVADCLTYCQKLFAVIK